MAPIHNRHHRITRSRSIGPPKGELGVGINLQPAAVRELVELGLGDALAETGIVALVEKSISLRGPVARASRISCVSAPFPAANGAGKSA